MDSVATGHTEVQSHDLAGAQKHACGSPPASKLWKFLKSAEVPRVHNGIRSRTRWKKDSKMILALSDSFRKLLSLLVLASGMALNCL